MISKTDAIIFIISIVAIILFIYLGYIAEKRLNKKTWYEKLLIIIFVIVLILCFVALEFLTKIICSMSHEQLIHLTIALAIPIAFVISQLYGKFKEKNKEIDKLKLLLHNACFDIDLYNKKSKEINERIAELKKRDITKTEMKFLDYVQREIDYISCPDSDYTHLPGNIHYPNNFHSRSVDLCDVAVQQYKNFNADDNEIHKLCYDVMQILTESSIRKEYYKENYKSKPLNDFLITSDYDPWRYCRNLLDTLNPDKLPEHGFTNHPHSKDEPDTAWISFDTVSCSRYLYMKFYDVHNESVVKDVFLWKRLSSKNIVIPSGKYHIKFISGDDWIDFKQYFKENNCYSLNRAYPSEHDTETDLSIFSFDSGYIYSYHISNFDDDIEIKPEKLSNF